MENLKIKFDKIILKLRESQRLLNRDIEIISTRKEVLNIELDKLEYGNYLKVKIINISDIYQLIDVQEYIEHPEIFKIVNKIIQDRRFNGDIRL